MIQKEQDQKLKNSPNKVFFVALEEEIPKGSVKYPVVYMGIGKVNAMVALVKWLKENPEQINDDLIIINAGTAGSAKYEPGTILCPDTFENGGHSMVRDIVSLGSSNIICRSADEFISFQESITVEQRMLKLSYDCFEMEAYPLARLCKELHIKFAAVKLVSDKLDGTVKDWEENIADLRPTLISYINSL